VGASLSKDDLLRPTLSDYLRAPELYNSTGFFMSAFFGGPLGAAIYGAANSHRIGRLSKDLSLLGAVVAGAFLLICLFHDIGWLPRLATIIGDSAMRSYELIVRAFGLLAYGAIYLMHRQFFRSARISGAKQIPGWVPGIVAVVAGSVANFAFVSWLLKHH
jgi:hypothetical protein